MGTDASAQPGDLKEIMLHETAVAWLTHRLTATTPREPWAETEDAFGARLRCACQYINDHHDVSGLCNDFLKRVKKLRQKKGDRLPH